ncbi:phage portal protein [Aminicella lysinilytica]|uniref:SPP1 Gp6-like portal protein n=1 Tax=Aminicella lysinilytica TaxID=433323 RepID=A0A4R6QD01_9FIRM|nr:phage portal protein [Aminicella lysinilytica]TDP59836.1 SPP1 Gp6-like portal protein [Aminicella lysinilytica]
MAELKGIEYLRRKMESKRSRTQLRYRYYEMKSAAPDPGPMIPLQLRNQYNSTLGWCETAVDALADRLVFDKFTNDNFDLNHIFDMNNPDTFFDSAVLSSLITSCCFVYISADETGFPRLQVIDGGNATGEIDPITGLLYEGYAVLKRNSDTQRAEIEAYFTPDYTQIYDKTNNTVQNIKNDTGYPLLVPIIYRPDAKRPFGHSRISRACMNIQNKARHCLTRADISAEFYSFPQKYVVGMSQNAEPMDSWRATISAMLTFTKDEDGDKPAPGQFAQQSMEPHLSHYKSYVASFAGETGLTMDDLGFATENPSSAEAIKASHENLRLKARKAQRNFGSGFLNVGFLAACLRDKYPYQRRQLYLSKPTWEPIFEPDASQMSGIGDAAVKINQAIPGYFGAENMHTLTGIKGENDETGYGTGTSGQDTKNI